MIGVLTACSGNPLNLKPGATSVFEGLADITPSEAVDMALDKYDADRRYKGVLSLAKRPFAGEEVYVNLFASLVNDEDPGVRAASTRALGLHGRTEHAPLLAERLKDSDPSVRVEAARALQRIHSPVAVEPLLATLDPEKETEVEVRVEAARALGQYAQPKVLELLIASLSEDSLAINLATVSSLRTLTGQDFGFDRGAWQRWYRDTKDVFAARAAYLYPTFQRDKRWFEYVPFVPPPPNEAPSLPVGLSPDLGGATGS